MSATILRFPGFLLDADGKGFRKDGKYHANADALLASLSEAERYRMLEWRRRRFPDAGSKQSRDGAA
jgi:hypothetical protein